MVVFIPWRGAAAACPVAGRAMELGRSGRELAGRIRQQPDRNRTDNRKQGDC
jgi:hypothetical protein